MPGLGQVRPLGQNETFGLYAYRAGAGAAVVAVPAGAYLSTVAGFAAAAGATMQIGGGDAIPIPNPGSASADVNCTLQGPLNVTFVGTGGYLVDWFMP